MQLQLSAFIAFPAIAQDQIKGFEIYGYIKTDIGYNFNQINPDWFDVLRVTKLPQYKDQFAPDGKIYFSIRESRMGFKSWLPGGADHIRTNFEFDVFGVGDNVGQSAFHLRTAYIQLGGFLIGKNQSLFTDADVVPGILDFGGPPGRPSLRSIQVRYMQNRETLKWGIALEQPGATSDEGIYAERIELQNVKPEFKLPDLTAQYRMLVQKGYIEAAGVLKWIKWKNTTPGPINLSGDEIGFGFYVSSRYRLHSKTLIKAQIVYGKGMENYLTDAGPDIGIKNNLGNATTPIVGVSLPVIGGLAFLEYNWGAKWISTLGYSGIRIYNSNAQAGNAFRNGHYGIINLLYQPVAAFIAGVELQWGQRKNYNDGFGSSAIKVQFSCKYSFSHLVQEKINK